MEGGAWTVAFLLTGYCPLALPSRVPIMCVLAQLINQSPSRPHTQVPASPAPRNPGAWCAHA